MAATILAFGRAMGETMAVAMLIGNSPRLSWSLLSPAGTLAGLLANQFGEAKGLQISALMYAALALVVLTLFVNMAGEAVLRRAEKATAGIRYCHDNRLRFSRIECRRSLKAADRNSRARILRNNCLDRNLRSTFVLDPHSVIFDRFFAFQKGIPLLTPSVFTQLPPAPGLTGGGFGNAIQGTVVMVGSRLLISVPLGSSFRDLSE